MEDIDLRKETNQRLKDINWTLGWIWWLLLPISISSVIQIYRFFVN